MDTIIRHKNIIIIVVIVLFVLHFIFIRYPQAQVAYKELLVESEKIDQLPQIEIIRSGNTPKWSSATVATYYYSTHEQKEVLKHYHDELIANGWKLQSVTPFKYEGKDYGGKRVLYKKGDYCAYIRHYGEMLENGEISFYFGVSWGVNTPC